LARIHAITNIRRQHISKLLTSWGREPVKPIPQIDLDEVKLSPSQLALRMREYWVLQRGPIENLVNIIEEAGGIVILSDFSTRLLDGISFRIPGLPPLFFMNSQVPGDRFRFSLAHELGHMIMHGIPDDDEKMERQADEFAASFLMPHQDVKPYLMNVSLSKLGRVKTFWKVSIKSLIRRAYDLRMITGYNYKSLNIEYSKARYNEGEPHPIEIEKPTFLTQLIEHHTRNLGYAIPELSRLLCVEEADFVKAYIPHASGLRLVISNDK
jgi:Zn-dependent peptidase ImmA (M78 family)